MISQPRPIEVREFPVPTTESPFSFKSFAFLFFNILSGGIYGTVQSLAKAHTITQLHLKQQDLQEQAAKILEHFDSLNVQIDAIRRRLNTGETGEAMASVIDQLELRFQATRIDIENLTEQDRQITRVSPSFIQFVGILLSNVVTVGLYGMFLDSNQNSCMAALEAQNAKIQDVIVEKKRDHSIKIPGQLGTLRTQLRLSQEKKELLESELGQAFFDKKEADKRASRLEQEKGVLSEDLRGLQASEERLRRSQLQLNENVVRASNELEEAKQRNAELRAQRASEINGISISQLKGEEQNLRNKANSLQSVFNKEQNLELELTGLRQITLNELQRSHLELGPIPSKCPGEGEIAGDYGLAAEDGDQDRWSDYTKRYAGQKTAVELMQTSMEYAFDDLIAMARQENPKIHWNESADIWYDTEAKYTENRSALYRHMIWDFISHSSLIQVTDHSYALRLNNEGVTMASSMPLRCQGIREVIDEKEVNGEKVEEIRRVAEVRVLPTIIDDFTPATDDRELSFGIDPVSAKRIFAQLSDEEKGHLQNLLLDPLIANEHPDLLSTRAFMRSGAAGRVELVRNAYELICDIALAVEKKFANKGLAQVLGGMADDYDLQPFHKEEMVQAPISEQPVQAANSVVEWTPDLESLKVKVGTAYLQESFGKTVKDSVDLYKKIYTGMSEAVIDNPNHILYTSHTSDQQIGTTTVKGILHQFTYKHPMYGYHGCLMSAMTSIIMTDDSKACSASVQNLKNAMAAYLDIKENAARFANKIATNHRRGDRPVYKPNEMTQEKYQENLNKWLQDNVKSYQSWLRNDGDREINNSNLGDVEIEIVACMIGVRIAVFYPKQPTKLNEFGLTIPADERFYYGPNTKETLFLFNSTGCTYAGLWPKMKADKFATEEMKAASRTLERYVGRISG